MSDHIAQCLTCVVNYEDLCSFYQCFVVCGIMTILVLSARILSTTPVIVLWESFFYFELSVWYSSTMWEHVCAPTLRYICFKIILGKRTLQWWRAETFLGHGIDDWFVAWWWYQGSCVAELKAKNQMHTFTGGKRKKTGGIVGKQWVRPCPNWGHSPCNDTGRIFPSPAEMCLSNK